MDKRKDEHRDDRWDKKLSDAARGYNEPPVTPRDAMWARIEARRTESRQAHRIIRSPWWQSRKILWPAAAAAVLILGIAIGRVTVQPEDLVVVVENGVNKGAERGGEKGVEGEMRRRADNVFDTDRGAAPEITNENEQIEAEKREAEKREHAVRIYQYAAAPVLNRAEMLLTQFRAGETVGTNNNSFSSRAVRLLTETRLLLDSPAAEDHELQRLLKDLELVLARIVRFTADSQDDEQQWITEGMQQRSLLPRLRTQVPGLSPGRSL